MSSQLIQKINTALKPNGYRQSDLRDKIIAILDLSDEPITVLDLMDKLKLDKLKPNKTTIYRELYTLMGHKFIEEVDFGEGKKRYELATDSTHSHLICESCGSIKCTRLNTTIESWLNSFTTQNNFALKRHILQFYGLCDQCLAKN
jgi:Fur family ferric uptake transcriptional regulator